MGININIATKFDSKGLRLAKKDLANATKDLKNSTASLGKNFAVLGAGLVGVGALISKNAKSLARIEAINAQTDATIKSMGNTAGISAEQIQKLAGSLEAVTATEAETIQEGANLLLTFKNIKNEAGAGNDIFNQTTTAMVDLARAMGTDASGEAIRLGKALNDPVKGISALTRVGVSFTEQQKTQIKALAESGDLMGAQKVILAELQAQFGGSGAAYAKTFSGQLELMGHELDTVGEEATMAVMPALQNMVAQLRLLIPVIGPQLKAAIESVNWQGLVTSVVSFTTFLIQNAQTIATVVAALWTLSTILKIVSVVMAATKALSALYTVLLVAQTAATGGLTVAQTLLNAAMLANPIGLIVAGLALLAGALYLATIAANNNKTATNGMNAITTKYDLKPTTASWNKYGTAIEDTTGKINGYKTAIDSPTSFKANDEEQGILGVKNAWNEALRAKQAYANIPITSPAAGGPMSATKGTAPTITGTTTATTTGGALAPKTLTGLQTINKTIKQQVTMQNQFGKLTDKLGFSEGLAGMILGGKNPIKTAKAIIQGTAKAANKIKNQYLKTAAGIAEANQVISDSSASVVDDRANFANNESVALKETERLYESFMESVKQTFGQIKDSIMGAFNLPDLGTSSSSVIRNMEKMLTKVRAFAKNVADLSTMGLDPALLNQIISAGPMAGSQLAAGLVSGGVEALSTINAGYAEIGALSAAIATTGTMGAYGSAAQQTIYNIAVEGGVGSGSTIGKAIVDAIKAYERTSGAVWQGA